MRIDAENSMWVVGRDKRAERVKGKLFTFLK